MNKKLVFTVLAVFSLAGVSLAYMIQAPLPNCNGNWTCAKALSGTAVACACNNTTTNTVQDYIYTLPQVNAMANQEVNEDAVVNTVLNAQ